MLEPLIDCKNSIIREGILAMLAELANAAEPLAEQRGKENWTSFQLADRLLLDRLRARQEDWKPYIDVQKRQEAGLRFREYAYRWY